MLSIKTFMMESGGWKCDNPNCKHSAEYHDHILGSNYYIKQDTICMYIALDEDREVYCGECIPEIFNQIKMVIDPNLKAFR